MFKFAVPTILIGVSIAGFFMFVSPTYTEITNLQKEVASYNEALSNSKTLEAERDKLTQKVNEINADELDRLSKLLPDGVDNIKLILEIEKIAAPYGMVLRDVKYEAKRKETATDTSGAPAPAPSPATLADKNKIYGSWDLGFSLQGNYYNFLNFTKDLESNLRIVDISSVAFSSDVGQGVKLGSSQVGTDLYKYDFNIKTYWLKN